MATSSRSWIFLQLAKINVQEERRGGQKARRCPKASGLTLPVDTALSYEQEIVQ